MAVNGARAGAKGSPLKLSYSIVISIRQTMDRSGARRAGMMTNRFEVLIREFQVIENREETFYGWKGGS